MKLIKRHRTCTSSPTESLPDSWRRQRHEKNDSKCLIQCKRGVLEVRAQSHSNMDNQETFRGSSPTGWSRTGGAEAEEQMVWRQMAWWEKSCVGSSIGASGPQRLADIFIYSPVIPRLLKWEQLLPFQRPFLFAWVLLRFAFPNAGIESKTSHMPGKPSTIELYLQSSKVLYTQVEWRSKVCSYEINKCFKSRRLQVQEH